MAGIRTPPAKRDPAGGGVSLAERAYRAIREMIISLELPPGAVVDERELMARLRVGRTPTREALRRLAQERLVEIYPRRGMFVTGVDARDLARLSEVRTVLEAEAARLAAARASAEDRAALARLAEELARPAARDGRALIELDERIHRSVYRSTRNSFLEATLEEYFVLALRIWYLALDRAEELQDAVLEHRALLEAIVDGDGDRAAALMRAHVEDFERTMRRALLAA